MPNRDSADRSGLRAPNVWHIVLPVIYRSAEAFAKALMIALARNIRSLTGFAVWISTAIVMTLGMSGFTEPRESTVNLFVFSCGLSFLLHAAFFVTTLPAQWLIRTLPAWLIAAGLLPASVLVSTAFVGTATQLPSEISGFGAAVLFLLLYVDAWRILFRQPRRLHTTTCESHHPKTPS
jgi:hypothetical protein